MFASLINSIHMYCAPLLVTATQSFWISACLSLSQKYLFIPCRLLFSTFRYCKCNGLWLSSFVQFALNSDHPQRLNEQPRVTAMTSSLTVVCSLLQVFKCVCNIQS